MGIFDLHISETVKARELKFGRQIAIAYGYQHAKPGAAIW